MQLRDLHAFVCFKLCTPLLRLLGDRIVRCGPQTVHRHPDVNFKEHSTGHVAEGVRCDPVSDAVLFNPQAHPTMCVACASASQDDWTKHWPSLNKTKYMCTMRNNHPNGCGLPECIHFYSSHDLAFIQSKLPALTLYDRAVVCYNVPACSSHMVTLGL